MDRDQLINEAREWLETEYSEPDLDTVFTDCVDEVIESMADFLIEKLEPAEAVIREYADDENWDFGYNGGVRSTYDDWWQRNEHGHALARAYFKEREQ